MKNYVALVEIDKETGECSVVVPDLPGFSSGGDTYEKAIKNATEGMASHIEVMKEYGERVPTPRSLKDIKRDWDGWDEWNEDEGDYVVALIPVFPPYGTKKILISIDTSLIARIDMVTKNRSAFFASAAERLLNEEPLKKIRGVGLDKTEALKEHKKPPDRLTRNL